MKRYVATRRACPSGGNSTTCRGPPSCSAIWARRSITPVTHSARRCSMESASLSSDLGDRQGVAFAQSHLAGIARRNGDLQLAATLFIESARICHEIGDSRATGGMHRGAGRDTRRSRRNGTGGSALRRRRMRSGTHGITADLPSIRCRTTGISTPCAPRWGRIASTSLFSEGEAIPAPEISALLSNWRAHVVVDESTGPVAATR